MPGRGGSYAAGVTAAAPPPTLVPLADGRVLAVDDVGDPGGAPVLYLHGVPDSRLSRHPDDGLAAATGVRLLAVDRPGCGRSTSHPGRTLGSVADDLAAACRHLGVEQVAVLAWSASAPFAVALAARHPDLVTAVGLTAPLVPIDAYDDPDVLAAAGAGRALFAEMAAELPAEDVAAEVAPYLLPDPATPEAVAAHLRDEADEQRQAELDAVPGGFDRLVAATVEAVAQGRDGITQELATQAAQPDVALTPDVPVTVWSGTADGIAPPAFGRWWAAALPRADLHVLDGASHVLHLPRWADLLAALRP